MALIAIIFKMKNRNVDRIDPGSTSEARFITITKIQNKMSKHCLESKDCSADLHFLSKKLSEKRHRALSTKSVRHGENLSWWILQIWCRDIQSGVMISSNKLFYLGESFKLGRVLFFSKVARATQHVSGWKFIPLWFSWKRAESVES